MDRALEALDRLSAPEKHKLVKGLIAVVSHDGQLRASELELMRAVCSALHVPIPTLSGQA